MVVGRKRITCSSTSALRTTQSGARITNTVSSLPELLEKKRLIYIHFSFATSSLELYLAEEAGRGRVLQVGEDHELHYPGVSWRYPWKIF